VGSIREGSQQKKSWLNYRDTAATVRAVQRTDLDMDTDPRARDLAIRDNRIAQVNLDWDYGNISELQHDGVDVLSVFRDYELKELAEKWEKDEALTGSKMFAKDEGFAPDIPVRPIIGTAITVNAPGETVILRNLYLNSLGAPTGISISTNTVVHMEGLVVNGFAANGIEITPATGGAQVFVKDSEIRGNAASGIFASPWCYQHGHYVRHRRPYASGAERVRSCSGFRSIHHGPGHLRRTQYE
jgi:hypothetical protein